MRVPMPTIDRVLVRLEPLALLLPAEHPLARARGGPGSAASRGSRSMGCRPTRETPEWADLIVQFFALSGRTFDAAASAGHRARGAGLPPRAAGAPDPDVSRPCRRPRRRAPAARRSGSALRMVDGVAPRQRERGHHRPSRGGRPSSRRPRIGSTESATEMAAPGCPSRTRRALLNGDFQPVTAPSRDRA